MRQSPNAGIVPPRIPSLLVDHRPFWLLVGGFAAAILVLLVSGFLLLNALGLESQVAGQYSSHQLDEMRLLDKLEFLHSRVSNLLYDISADPDRRQAAAHQTEANQLRQQLLELTVQAKKASSTPAESRAWDEVAKSTGELLDAVTAGIRKPGRLDTAVAMNHRQFVGSVSRLLDSSYQESLVREKEEAYLFDGYFRRSATQLGVAVTLAIAATIGSVLLYFRSFQRLEQQAVILRDFGLHTLEEHERAAKRFAQDVHDEFGQNLSAIDATLSMIRVDSPEQQSRMQDARALVKESITTAREMVRLLRPSILDDFGLDAALRELAQGFSQRTGIVVDYTSNLRHRLAPQRETHLYRIAQEALTNVTRHSAARHVAMDLAVTGSALRFCIRDDGGGMQPPAHSGGERKFSLGLVGMAERANAAGGSLEIHNAPGQGVTIDVQIPFEPVADRPLPVALESEAGA